MLERGVLGLGAVLLAVPLSFVAIGASGRMVEAPHEHVARAISQFEGEAPVATASEPAEASFGNPLLRRLLWTATTLTVGFAPVAYVHAKWTGQEEAYVRFQRSLLNHTWDALLGMPESFAAFVVAGPALASAVYEDPLLLVQMGEDMISQTLDAAYAFATSDDDEVAAKIASSIIADVWLGKLLGGAGVGTGVAARSRRVALASSSIASKVRGLASKLPTGKRQLRAAAAGLCFTAGTLVHVPNGVRAIEEVELGARVVTTNGIEDTWTEVDESWCRIDLVMHDERSADGTIHLSLLRSRKWIQQTGARIGADIEITLEEMGVQGRAHVLSIKAPPSIAEGDGRVVLSTMRSKSDSVLTLRFEETEETLEPTPRHRLYSLDRAAFVAASALRVGERLRTRTGSVTIAAITRKSGVHAVYNLEVESEHEYFVSRSAVLSHNDRANACVEPSAWAELNRHHPVVPEDVWSKAVRERTIDVYKTRLREIIARTGLPQAAFARSIRISPGTVTSHLRPSVRRLPDTEVVVRLMKRWNVDPHWLLGLSDDLSLESGIRVTFSGPGLQMTAADRVRMRAEVLETFKPRYSALAIRSGLTDRAFAERLGRTDQLSIKLHAHSEHDNLPALETLVVLSKVEDVRMGWLLGYTDVHPPGITEDIMWQARGLDAASVPRGATRVYTRGNTFLAQLRVELNPDVGRRLVSLAADSGLSHKEFEQAIGLTPGFFRFLSTKQDLLPAPATLARIADLTDARIDWILGLSNERALQRSSAWVSAAQGASQTLPSVQVFRQRLVQVLERSELSHYAFAQKVGISRAALGAYVSPTRTRWPDTDILVSIAREQNVSVDWLLGLVD